MLFSKCDNKAGSASAAMGEERLLNNSKEKG